LAHFRAGNPFQPNTSSASPWIPVSSLGIGQLEPIPDLAARLSSHVIAGEDLLAAIDQARAPICDGHQGRTTVEMACVILASHQAGGARIAWPLANRENPLSR
jgi:hypothetical protein